MTPVHVRSALPSPPPAASPYLTTPGGRQLASRAWPAIRLFGGLIGGPVVMGLCIALGAALDAPWLVVSGGFGVLIVVLVSVALQWVAIFGSASRLRRAEAALLARDGADRTSEAVTLAQWALERVFRSDLRMRALYTLALVAERRADFTEAACLFHFAEQALPAFAGRSHATRLRALIAAHTSFCLAAVGDVGGGGAWLARAHHHLPNLGRTGLLEGLDDVAMGPLSINATLNEIEARRDPRAVAILAGALLAYRAREPQRSLDAFTGEAQLLAFHTMPHEQLFLKRLEAACIAALGGAQYRGAAVVSESASDEASAAWVGRILG
jgi:hypothetical protein